MAFRAFGKITVPAAGTPVRVTSGQTDPTIPAKVQSITFFALAGNSGTNIYVGSSTMNKSTLAGVYLIVIKGTYVSCIIQQAYDAIDAKDLYIDADTSNDAVLVTGLEC